MVWWQSGLTVNLRHDTLKIRLSHFETHACSRTLAAPTSDDRVIFDMAWEARPVELKGRS